MAGNGSLMTKSTSREGCSGSENGALPKCHERVRLPRRSVQTNRALANALEGRAGGFGAVLDADRAPAKSARDGAGGAAAQKWVEDQVTFVRASADHAFQVNLGNLVLMFVAAFLVVALNAAPIQSIPDIQGNAQARPAGFAG